MGSWLKDKLETVFGGAAVILMQLLAAAFVIIPLVPLGLPWWADTLLLIGIVSFAFLGGLISAGLAVWSFIVMLHTPFSWFTVVYYIWLALYVIFFAIPSVVKFFSKDYD